jgi:FMN-dependent NADH-azoreductase
MTLLHVDSSARHTSVSRQLTSQFVETWKKENPSGEVITRDLAATHLPLITDEWTQASFSEPEQWTGAQKAAIAASDELVAEILRADTIVIGAPMYNFTIPAPLKGWIDQIVRSKKTFSYGPEGPKGLLAGKKVFVITSRAGAYGPGSPFEKADFQAPYLRFILSFIGLTDVTFIHAEHQGREGAESARQAAVAKIQQAVHGAH